MSGLLYTAKLLAEADPRRPAEANLRRAVSTAYYAVFDGLARAGADTLVGARRSPRRAWVRIYRSLDHGAASHALEQMLRDEASSLEAKSFAAAFVKLRRERERADYDPDLSVTRGAALAFVREAEEALSALDGLQPDERMTLVVEVLFRRRPR